MGNKKKTKKASAYTDLVKAQRKDEERRARKHAKRKKIILSCVCVLGAALLITTGIFAVSYAIKYSGPAQRSRVAMSTEHYEIDNATMAYYYVVMEDSFLASGEQAMQQYGVDPKKSLREQEYQGKTWFDVLMSSVEENVKQMLVLLEAARDDGMTLTDEENAEVDKEADALDPDHYGKGISRDDLRRALGYSKLAVKYSSKMQEDATTTEADWDAYYAEHEKDYIYWNHATMTFSFAADSEGNADMTKDEAKAYADSLSAVTDETSYTAWAEEYYKKTGKSEEEIPTLIAGGIAESTAQNVEEAVAEWALSAKTGTSYVAESGESYRVYIMLSPAARKENKTVDVRHILVKTESYDDADAARAALEKLYEMWKENPTEDYFAELATTHTEDPGSKNTGGLYDGVAPGEMVESFDSWCFDPVRKAGDTGIVESSYGFHLLYFVGDGLKQWQYDVKTNMENEAYKTTYDALSEAHTVSTDTENLAKVAPDR